MALKTPKKNTPPDFDFFSPFWPFLAEKCLKLSKYNISWTDGRRKLVDPSF